MNQSSVSHELLSRFDASDIYVNFMKTLILFWMSENKRTVGN